ncbi:Acetyltransferase (GNAT) family protein [Candidatus Bilamarchaeum dharawalense]|uniref:Acetyltransferase (GNAT) family protein n=1 Tax=Candidatus Bilamarchaeum dharawalense TaxID=2885759 RepID=A0A5E4LR65_9ARCH|nr:Acetyltransferase (GNAT) family protein [Candidatus Bilamarchaeum dharawalense]
MRTRYLLKSGLDVIYRPFEHRDIQKCSQILLRNFEPLKSDMSSQEWQQHFGQIYTLANLPKLARERHYRVVALSDGEVVGLMGFIPYSNQEAEISNLSIDPLFQRKGLGKLLITTGLLSALDSGVITFCADAGLWSKAILVTLGFQTDPERSNKYGKRVQFIYATATSDFKVRVLDMLGLVIVGTNPSTQSASSEQP